MAPSAAATAIASGAGAAQWKPCPHHGVAAARRPCQGADHRHGYRRCLQLQLPQRAAGPKIAAAAARSETPSERGNLQAVATGDWRHRRDLGPSDDGSSFFGPGYKWDEKDGSELGDSAAQMLSLCLKWRRKGDPFSSQRLNKLQGLWDRQQTPYSVEAPRRQLLSCLLLKHLLEDWDECERSSGRDKTPQQAAARSCRIEALVGGMVGCLEPQASRAPPEDTGDPDGRMDTWRRQHAAEYSAFMEAQISAAQSRELKLSPLKHALQLDEVASSTASPSDSSACLLSDGASAAPPMLLPGGLWLEFGVAEGRTLGFIARRVVEREAADAQAASPAGGVVWGFDSFEGLPEYWRPGFSRGHFQRPDGALPEFRTSTEAAAERIRLVKGWFSDTLPEFLDQHPEPVALLHLDCDIYSSAIYVMTTLIEHGRLQPGTVIVFDELFNYSGFECHEMLALFEAMKMLGLRWTWVGVSQKGRMQASLVVDAVGPPWRLRGQDGPGHLASLLPPSPSPPPPPQQQQLSPLSPPPPQQQQQRQQKQAAKPSSAMKKKKQKGHRPPQPARQMPAALTKHSAVLAAPVAVPLEWIPEATLSSLQLPPEAGTVNLAMEMGKAIAEELLGLSISTHNANGGSAGGSDSVDSDDVCRALESYQITKEMKRTANYKGRQQNGTIHERIARCERFCALYETLIRRVIGPHLLDEITASDRDQCRKPGGQREVREGAAARTVLYQFPPAVRMYCSHIVLDRDREERDRMAREGELMVTPPPATSLSGEEERARLIESTQANYISLTSLHADEKYGHQPGELNFWMPFTDIDETSTVWAESAPGREDWHPFFPLERGGLWRFPGTECRHFTKPNISGRARVSLDFRLSVATCYDREWRMPGDTHRHEMREMQL